MTAGFKKYFANFSWVMVEKAIRMVVAFCVTAYVARYLGPKNYGFVAFAISFVALFSAFGTLGLDSIITRNIVRDREQSTTILGTSFVLKALGGLAGYVSLVIAVLVTGYDSQSRLLILIVGLNLVQAPFSVIEQYFRAKVAAKFITMSNLVAVFATAAFRLILVFLGISLAWFAAAVILERAVLNVMYLLFYQKNAKDLMAWRFRPFLAKEYMRDSWPLIFSGLVVMIYMRIDQVMIKGMLGPESVGLYSAAVYIAEGWYFLGMAASSTLFPAIVNAKKVDEKLYSERLQNFYRLMAWMAISIAVPIHFLAGPIIHLIYGAAFSQAADVLKVNIWTGVFVFLGVASSSWLVTENLQRISLIRTTLGAVMNIVLNLILIPRMGIIGAAYATLTSQATASYIAYAFSKTTYRTFVMQSKAFVPPVVPIFRKVQAICRVT
jgi:O-antigen/teichoic acid export membrane protein